MHRLRIRIHTLSSLAFLLLAACGATDAATNNEIPPETITTAMGPVDENSIAFVANRADIEPHEEVAFGSATLLGVPAYVRIVTEDGDLAIDLVAKWEWSGTQRFTATGDPNIFEGRTCFVDPDALGQSLDRQESCIERLIFERTDLEYSDRVKYEGFEYVANSKIQRSSPLTGTFIIAPDIYAPEGHFRNYSKYTDPVFPILPWESAVLDFSEPISLDVIEEKLQSPVDFSATLETALTATVYVQATSWWPSGQPLQISMPSYTDHAGNEGAINAYEVQVAKLPKLHSGRVEFDAEDDAVVWSDADFSSTGGSILLDDCLGSTTNDEGQTDAMLANYDVLIGLKGDPSFSTIRVGMDIDGGFDAPTAYFGFAEPGSQPRRADAQRLELEEGEDAVYEIKLDAPVAEGYLHYAQAHPGIGSEFCPSQSTGIYWVEVE